MTWTSPTFFCHGDTLVRQGAEGKPSPPLPPFPHSSILFCARCAQPLRRGSFSRPLHHHYSVLTPIETLTTSPACSRPGGTAARCTSRASRRLFWPPCRLSTTRRRLLGIGRAAAAAVAAAAAAATRSRPKNITPTHSTVLPAFALERRRCGYTQPTQLIAAGEQLAAHTQPVLRTGLMAPAWRLLHASQRAILGTLPLLIIHKRL